MNTVLISILGGCVLALIGVPIIHWVASQLQDIEGDGVIAPPPVLKASSIEFSFGLFVFLVSFGYSIVDQSVTSRFLVILLGVGGGALWIWLALQLRKGGVLLRQLFLVLSVLRMFTVVGCLISLPTLHLLFRNQDSIAFYQDSAAEREERLSPRI